MIQGYVCRERMQPIPQHTYVLRGYEESKTNPHNP